VRREIEKTGFEDKLASGAVITGGSTILEGMTELAEEVLGMPVRRGVPMGVGGLVDVVRTPAYATGVGLVQYGVKHLGVQHFQRGDADKRNVWQRMRNWFGEVF
jgi:cell division protein FtsA